jgi:hypothetical protein
MDMARWRNLFRSLWAQLVEYLNSGGALDVPGPARPASPPVDFQARTSVFLVRPARGVSDEANEVEYDLMAEYIRRSIGSVPVTVVCFAGPSPVYADTAANLSRRLNNGRLNVQTWAQSGWVTALSIVNGLALTETIGPVVIVSWQPGIVALLRESYILHPALKYLGMGRASEDMPLIPLPLILAYDKEIGAKFLVGW